MKADLNGAKLARSGAGVPPAILWKKGSRDGRPTSQNWHNLAPFTVDHRPPPWAILLALLLIATSAFADGGVVLGEKDADGLRITLFAQPVPLRAGPADFSVLVQGIASGQPVMDADVRLSLKKLSAPSPDKAWSPPYCQVAGTDGSVRLLHDLSRNKLLYAAMVSVPEAGRWEMSVAVTSGGSGTVLSLPLDVAAPLKPLSTWWPAIALLPFAIALYAWRAALVRSRRRLPDPPP